MHPYLVAKLADERRADLLWEAQRRSLAAAVSPPSPLRQRLGHRFIGWGERLVSSTQHPVGNTPRI